MAVEKRWVLSDLEQGIHEHTFSVTQEELALKTPHSWSVRKRTLHGGLADGVEVVEISTGPFSFVVVPTRGMGIWRGSYKGSRLGWRSPARGPVHPKFVRLEENNGLGWLAGFDEWIVRCGLSSNGAPGPDVLPGGRERLLTLHGRIANIPAHRVELRVAIEPPFAIEIVGVVDEAMLFFPELRLTTRITTYPGASTLTLHDEIENISSQPAECQLLYHCNFGPPLLGEGSRLLAPFKRVAPRDAAGAAVFDHFSMYPGPTPGVAEQVLFMQLVPDAKGNTLAALVDPSGERACVLRYSNAQLPWFTLWRLPGAESDGFVTGLEPGTNLPNPKRFERQAGRVKTLAPGEKMIATLTVEMQEGKEAMSRLVDQVSALQKSVSPKFHPHPVQELSPG